jgi:hypothetical protein
MKKNLFLLTLILLVSGCTIGSNLSYRGNKKMNKLDITILDQQTLTFQAKKGLLSSEISDLSYNPKEHKLYMIGDKGYFHVFEADFSKYIDKMDYLDSFKIEEKAKHQPYDSEGLTSDNRGNLYVSFEKNPRITQISKNGFLQRDIKLTHELKNKNNFQGSNKIFEALAWHPRYGLLTVAEYPLYKRKNTDQTIYSLHGRKWHFKTAPHLHNAVTAIEVMDDGNLLVLERAYAGLTKPFVITLRKVYINRCDKNRFCQSKVLASLNSFDGWSVNNYEGLTKIAKNRYLMVSDNNNKSILKTVLVYFKINE